MIDPHIFRAYDIRGKALTQLTEEACHLIGKGFGTVLRESYNKEHPTVAVGRDARTHGPQLESALIQGLKSTGCHVYTIGQTPSPTNYFTICDQGFDGGVQVTASHNPAPDNGLKLQLRDAEAYAGDSLQELRVRIEQEDFATGEGTNEPYDSIEPYIQHLSNLFGAIGTGKKVAVDAGNGVAGPAYCSALRAVGCEVIELYTEPDGTFPNHPADPSKHSTLKELQELVVSENAICGFAFDGDGDRLGLVDEKGAIRNADDILMLLAQDHLQRNTGAPVVFTVSNSGVLDTEITRLGGKPVMCKVGHSFVEHAMHKHHAKLGGEQSGHFFCGEDYFSFDDAIVATLRILDILNNSESNLSQLCESFPEVYQAPEVRPNCPDDKKSAVISAVTEHFAKEYPVITLDGVRIDFGDGAWAGIRQSNTSPKISICIEARSEEKLAEVQNLVFEHMKQYPEVDLSSD